MAKTTGFRKVRSGGVDQGDITLTRFGMVPITQKSPGVSAFGQARIGVVPDDGADVMEILTLVDIATGGSAARVTLDFGTSANTSAFGVIVVGEIGRYTLPFKNAVHQDLSAAPTVFLASEHDLTVNVSGSNYTVASAGQHILVTVTSASGGNAVAPGFICYTTYLQNLADS